MPVTARSRKAGGRCLCSATALTGKKASKMSLIEINQPTLFVLYRNGVYGTGPRGRLEQTRPTAIQLPDMVQPPCTSETPFVPHLGPCTKLSSFGMLKEVTLSCDWPPESTLQPCPDRSALMRVHVRHSKPELDPPPVQIQENITQNNTGVAAKRCPEHKGWGRPSPPPNAYKVILYVYQLSWLYSVVGWWWNSAPAITVVRPSSSPEGNHGRRYSSEVAEVLGGAGSSAGVCIQ